MLIASDQVAQGLARVAELAGADSGVDVVTQRFRESEALVSRPSVDLT